MNNNLSEGISALKAGNREAARSYLAQALREDPNSERAWQWMYNAANNDSERKKCLNEILRINPANQKAAQMLAQTDGINIAKVQDKSVDEFRETIETVSGQERKKNQNIVIGILIVVILCILSCACLFVYLNFAEVDTPDEYLKEYGGSPEVYAELLTSNDCNALQESFDQAYLNNQRHEPGTNGAMWTSGYMTAAHQRMEEIGCYEQQPQNP
ncbi:MAG TPA: hypothetical protein DCG54_07665 [Anaerolineae bacterium]|jgi:tetratricopeptide (TPR) repeat protein|nr:hypothetical protein [Anaerolineae bacterium]